MSRIEQPKEVIISSSLELNRSAVADGFTKEADLAQYKGSDYSNAVRVRRNITLEEAFNIAESDHNIGYFMYVKGAWMVLEYLLFERRAAPSENRRASTCDNVPSLLETRHRPRYCRFLCGLDFPPLVQTVLPPTRRKSFALSGPAGRRYCPIDRHIYSPIHGRPLWRR